VVELDIEEDREAEDSSEEGDLEFSADCAALCEATGVGSFEDDVFEAADGFGEREADMTKREKGDVLRVFLKDLEKVTLLGPDEEKNLGKTIADSQNEILGYVSAAPTRRLGKLKHLIRKYQAGRANGGISSLSRQKLCEEAESKIGKLLSQEIPEWDREDLKFALQRIKSARSKKEVLEAKEKLVVSNLPLAVNIARMFWKPGRILADLIQDGSIGLIRAAEKFEYELGFKFSTYASYWIKQKIASGIVKRAGLVHRPRNLMEDIAKIRALEKDPSRGAGGLSDVAEIAELTGLSEQEVQRACESISFTFQSLEASLGRDGEGGTFAEAIPDRKPSPFEETFASERLSRVEEIFQLSLDPLETKVLKMRFGIGGEPQAIYKEIGEALNLSHEGVRLVEKRALRKLKNFPVLEKLHVPA